MSDSRLQRPSAAGRLAKREARASLRARRASTRVHDYPERRVGPRSRLLQGVHQKIFMDEGCCWVEIWLKEQREVAPYADGGKLYSP